MATGKKTMNKVILYVILIVAILTAGAYLYFNRSVIAPWGIKLE